MIFFFRIQTMFTEQNKLQKKVEDTEREFCFQKNTIVNAHAEEVKILVEVD